MKWTNHDIRKSFVSGKWSESENQLWVVLRTNINKQSVQRSPSTRSSLPMDEIEIPIYCPPDWEDEYKRNGAIAICRRNFQKCSTEAAEPISLHMPVLEPSKTSRTMRRCTSCGRIMAS